MEEERGMAVPHRSRVSDRKEPVSTPSGPHSQPLSKAFQPVDPAMQGRTRRRGHEVGDQKDLRPIGKARLKALREAIRNGTYPSNESVEQGLLRMFTRPTPPRSQG